jgi:hypothetical protein
MAITGSKQPVFSSQPKLTFKAGAAVTAGRLVEITGVETVSMAAAKSQKVVGVSMQTCDAVGDLLEVQVLGNVFTLVAQGAVTAGDELVVGSVAGTVATQAVAGTATLTDINNARAIVGIALDSAADTGTLRVLVSRA